MALTPPARRASDGTSWGDDRDGDWNGEILQHNAWLRLHRAGRRIEGYFRSHLGSAAVRDVIDEIDPVERWEPAGGKMPVGPKNRQL